MSEEIIQLNKKVDELETFVIKQRFSDRMIINQLMQFLDERNLEFGLNTGTKIGTATTQKLGFWNSSPVVQQTPIGQITGFTANVGNTVKDDSTFTGGTGSTVYTIGDIIAILKTIGLFKS